MPIPAHCSFRQLICDTQIPSCAAVLPVQETRQDYMLGALGSGGELCLVLFDQPTHFAIPQVADVLD